MTRAHRHTITLNLSNAIFERLIERCNAAGIGPSRWASDVLTRELGGKPTEFNPVDSWLDAQARETPIQDNIDLHGSRYQGPEVMRFHRYRKP